MHVFKIVREHGGWSVQFGRAVSAPCKSQTVALAQAQHMADAIRRHGEAVTVIVEPANESAADDTKYFLPSPRAAAAARIRAPKRLLRTK